MAFGSPSRRGSGLWHLAGAVGIGLFRGGKHEQPIFVLVEAIGSLLEVRVSNRSRGLRFDFGAA